MGRPYNPVEAYALMNTLVKEATGQDASITAVDTSSFVSAGETVLSTGVTNTLNALSAVIGRTLIGVRPYQAKFRIMNALDTGAYAHRMRKISFYSRNALPAGNFNTLDPSDGDPMYTNLADGYDNGTNSGASVPSMWVQNQPVPLEVNFAGSSVWQDSTTVYEYQLKAAFSSEQTFMDFVSGIMTEKGNDIESQKEAFSRMTLLNRIAGNYDLASTVPSGAVNMTAEFNDFFGTSYDSDEILSEHTQQFLEFFIARVKEDSDMMTNRSALYHWSPAKTIGSTSYTLLRHTPKAQQKMFILNKFMNLGRSVVLPEIFNDQYLNIENYEGVDYWQNINNPAAISVTPAIPDVSDPKEQTAGSAVALDYVLGVLYDNDALMTDFQLEDSATTPLEARKRYRNIWWSFAKNAINDFTENFIVYYMEDEAEA